MLTRVQRVDKVVGYHGVILFKIPSHEVLYQISAGLPLPIKPFDRLGAF